MANNGIYYSSGHSLNFTTSGVTWMNLSSGGTLNIGVISGTSYIDFNTGTTNPSQTGGRVFFDNDSKALSYYDVTNNLVPIAMGQQLYIRVYNETGAQIDKGKVIAITGTSNSLPSIILAVNNHAIGSDRPIGVAAENIPDGSEGLVLNNGILSGITLNTFANGDTLYLSDTIPGGYVSSTSSLAFSARTNEIGYVLETGTTTGKIYVNINSEDSNLTLTDIERNILEGNVISSGVYEYTGMTLGTGATINVAEARGWIVRNTYGFATLPDVINLYYTGGTNIPITNLATADSTFILINSASTLVQQITFPTPQERRENIFLGKVVHPTRTSITSLNQTVDFDVSPMAALRDLWTPLKLINQDIVVSPTGTGMTINKSAGYLWGNGIGWITNQLNPDSVSISGTSPTTFQYRSQLGPLTGGSVTTGNTTTIDPAYYDLNGVVTAVGGGSNSSTNQRVYLFPTGLVRIQLGQQVYGTLAEAVAGVQTEQFVEYSLNRENGILIGIISLNKNASIANGGLVNTGYAIFNFTSKFGEVLGGTGGLSTTTLQQAYDNSVQPEITINSTLDGVSIKNGTGNADNITNLLEGINSSNTTTSFIRADGAFSGTSIFGTGLTATTVSATTYLNLPYTGTTNYIPKWTNTTGLTDSQIQDDGTRVSIGGVVLDSTFSVNGSLGVRGIQINNTGGSIGITDVDLTGWGSSGGEIAIGTGSPLASSTGTDNIAIGYGSLKDNTTGIDNVAIGYRTLYVNQAGQGNVAIGKDAGIDVTSGSYNVFIGYQAGGSVTTEDNRLYIANNSSTPLIYGEFDNGIVNINGTLSATTYDNLPGSSSANCFTTFFVTNISGCSPVNVLSPLNVKDGLSVTGTSTFINQVNFDGGISASTFSAGTYQNLPFYNAGLLTNSDQWINNNDGTVTLPSAYAALYNQTIYPSVVEVFLISSGTSGTQFPALSNNDTNYVVIDYSGGTPSWDILTDNSTINGETIVLTHIIYRANNFLHVLDFGNEGIALPNKINDRIVAVNRFGRESGFSLGLSGSGVVTLTSGVAWNGTNRQSLVPVNSQDDIFFQSYHTGGTWTYTTSANTLNNLYYDNGTNPVLATGGKYLVNWYFRGQEINDHLYEVWGVDEYDSVSEAQLSTEPNLPELITSHAFLTGRIIVQVSATTGTVESAFVQVFQPSTVQAHNDLTSIQGGQAGEYYHLTSSEYNNLSSFKNIQVDGVTQFSSTSLTDNLNFSGINITITSAATNTLVFSAGTGGGGAVSSVTAGSGLSGNSTTGAITLINTQVQGITGITASSGISASTTDNVTTLINTGVTGITAGSNITINQSTGNVTINSTGGGTGLGTVYTTANNFNFL